MQSNISYIVNTHWNPERIRFQGDTGCPEPSCLPKLSPKQRLSILVFNKTVFHSLTKKDTCTPFWPFYLRLVTASSTPRTYTETNNFSSLEQMSPLVTQDQRLNHLRKLINHITFQKSCLHPPMPPHRTGPTLRSSLYPINLLGLEERHLSMTVFLCNLQTRCFPAVSSLGAGHLVQPHPSSQH